MIVIDNAGKESLHPPVAQARRPSGKQVVMLQCVLKIRNDLAAIIERFGKIFR